jgi:hypothetical protein
MLHLLLAFLLGVWLQLKAVRAHDVITKIDEQGFCMFVNKSDIG